MPRGGLDYRSPSSSSREKSHTSNIALQEFVVMTHVVAEPCFACKYTDCVVVCPVE
jgi:Fe-S-cluster-containing dehydrogenase component